MKTSRLDRVVRGMEKIGLSQALVTATESVYYLTGLWIAPGERLLALLIDPKGCKLFVNHMFQAPKVEGLELVEFDDADDSVAALASRVAPGRLGVDKAWPSRFLLSLMEKRPDLHPVNGSAPVDEARMLKDREEIEALRISSHMNDRVTGLLRQRLAEGETELDAARRYGELGALEGASGLGFEPLICFGAGCAEPHHVTGKARLQKGDAVILDVGLNVDHALSDMTRTPFGQYLYTEFLLTGFVHIPEFSAIKINWEGRLNRDFPLDAQEVAVHLEFTYEKCYSETRMIYWEAETDWDVTLAKAKEQCGPVENARSKGYMELK
jgi:Xaa-Pro dipeptidase